MSARSTHIMSVGRHGPSQRRCAHVLSLERELPLCLMSALRAYVFLMSALRAYVFLMSALRAYVLPLPVCLEPQS
jgi:hypothetical protein